MSRVGKKGFVFLLLAAISVWIVVAVEIVWISGGGDFKGAPVKVTETKSWNLDLFMPAKYEVDTTLRDPFESYLYASKPRPKPRPKVTKKQIRPSQPKLKVVAPPRAKLNGILWGPNPVAILARDGKSELLKKGDEGFGLTIQKIERHQVIVTKDGREFTLTP